MKRLRIGIARLLTLGTGCTVIRKSAVEKMQGAANALEDYVNKSGALNDSKWIHAWRKVHVLVADIRSGANDSEVGA